MTNDDHSGFDLVNLAAIIRTSRMGVCEAFFQCGDPSALAALAAASVRLSRWIDNGSLRPTPVYRALWGVSINLGMVRRLGRDVVKRAIATGPIFYIDLREAA